jgi:FixJ family two-component response regulator
MVASGRSYTKGRLVIVVEDDSAVLNALKFALGVDGYEVATYATGRELLESTGSTGKHAIHHVGEACLVLDYHLADMNGLELAAVLRARGITAPAILITTNPSVVVLRSAFAAGVNVVEKPLMGSDLSSAIGAALASCVSPLG